MYCVYKIAVSMRLVGGKYKAGRHCYVPWENKADGSYGFDLEEALDICREANNAPQFKAGMANAYVAPMPAGGVVN